MVELIGWDKNDLKNGLIRLAVNNSNLNKFFKNYYLCCLILFWEALTMYLLFFCITLSKQCLKY